MNTQKESTTRRHFCMRLAGAAFTGAFVGGESMAGANTESQSRDAGNRTHLAAACGTYCGACPAYLAKYGEVEQIKKKRQIISSTRPTTIMKGIPPSNWMDGLQCDGCLSGGILAAHCQRCDIRLCAADKQQDARCSGCQELPCHRITNLMNMGSYLHRTEYLPNLENMREMGVQEWLEKEEARWRCPQCGLPMSWYDTECIGCGEKRSDRLFSLEQG